MQVQSASIGQFNEWKLGKKNENPALIFRVIDGVIQLVPFPDKVEADLCWEDFVKVLSKMEACWAFKGFHYKTKTGGARSKLVMIQWIPETATGKEKITYTMWSKNIKNALNGIHSAIQANGLADLDYETVLERVSQYDADM